jgi:transaldolase/glucose-6-phosphate isomerase
VAQLGAWLEQLLGESTGRQGKGVVPVDKEPVGQPSVYGADRLFCYIALTGADDAEQTAKITALEAAGQPVVRVELSDLYDLGREFFRWEFATAVAGSIIGIDPFDQPDVEEGKVLARQLTDRYDQDGSLPELPPPWEGEEIKLYADERNGAELSSAVEGHPGLVSYLAALLDQAGPGDYVALLAYVQMAPAHEAVLTEMRTLVRHALRVATCVGFGPASSTPPARPTTAAPAPGCSSRSPATTRSRWPCQGTATASGW